MLFTSALFAFVYLPVVWLVFRGLGYRTEWGAALWLFVASLAFYAVWMPQYTVLLLLSIGFNFVVGRRIAATRVRIWVVLGVVANLALLGYYKYANFFIDNLNLLLGFDWAPGKVLLPLGISFFTFTQIAFLVDAHRKQVQEPSFVHYGLFVTYFPHLVAGPVLHHAQMMPQFRQRSTYRYDGALMATGAVWFAVGLFKKVVLADGISPYADAVFNGADQGVLPSTPEAWLGAVAYALQLYFDFSGYSDMAIGLSWMFNIQLPFNFNSPYRATNISEFWRRWHISLSSFLRDYLYIALGGNRRGQVRRYANLLATMVLGGLWHGASWSFVVWGSLHGLFLVLHQLYRRWCPLQATPSGVHQVWAWALTMCAVSLAWVFFRATTWGGALHMFQSMAGLGGGAGAASALLWNQGLNLYTGVGWCVLLAMVAVLPWNSNRLGVTTQTWLQAQPSRSPAVLGGMVMLSVALLLLNNTRGAVGAFIYFNF